LTHGFGLPCPASNKQQQTRPNFSLTRGSRHR
jgi:hypothetical protein